MGAERPSSGGNSRRQLCAAHTGMSELEEGLLSGQIEEEEVNEPGSGMSLSVAQPLVRDWLAKRRANLRPVGTFFNTANFQVVMWRCWLC